MNMNKSRKTNDKLRKQINKTKKTKTQRKKSKISGGRLFGSGAYGVYYGLPPIPCIPGTSELENDYNDHKYVTKLFENPAQADEEYDVLDRIEHSSLSTVEDLDEFFVLPIDRCDVDKIKINTNTQLYTDDWKKDSKNRYYLLKKHGRYPVLKANLGLPVSDGNPWVKVSGENIWQKTVPISSDERGRFYSTMNEPNDGIIWSQIIIYPKAECDLASEVNKLISLTDYKAKINFFVTLLSKMKNISDGIAILQQHNFVHGDIKDENCLVILEEDGETLYKIGDVSFLASIIDHAPRFPKWDSAFYYCWPLLSVYSYFFHDSFSGPVAIAEPDLLTLNYIIKNQKDVESNFIHVRNIFKPIVDKFNLIKQIVHPSFKPYLDYVIKMMNKIYLEKQILYDNGVRRDLESGTRSHNVNVILTYYTNWDFYFNSLGVEERKLDLYKRIDVYSFGFMIIKFIYICLDNITITEVITNLNPIIYIVKLFIIIDMCCLQVYNDDTPRPPISFDFINKKFDEIVFGQEIGQALFDTLRKLYDETVYLREVRPHPNPPTINPSSGSESDSAEILHSP